MFRSSARNISLNGFGSKAREGDFGSAPCALCRSESDGFVWEIQIPNPGTNLVGVPTVTISGGGGTGATGTARVKVVSVTIAAAGAGYVVGDSITLAGINGALLTVTCPSWASAMCLTRASPTPLPRVPWVSLRPMR